MLHRTHYRPFLFLFAVILIIVPSSLALSAPTAVSFTAPGNSDTALAELDEFATNVMADPWDMNEQTDLFYIRSESQINNGAFANGIYSGTMSDGVGKERITLLPALGQNNTAFRTGKSGYAFPINTNDYRYLTLRIYKSNSDNNSGRVDWFEDDSFTNLKLGPTFGISGSGWKTIVLHMGSDADWTGTVRELIVRPFAGNGAAGATVKLDYARLTAENPNTARPFTIRWNGGSGNVTLYASQGDKTLDADDYLIDTVPSSDGTYTFQTGVLPAGKYYIAAVESGATSWSTGALVINEIPQVAITKPSMTSGEEWSRDIIGNEWDMEQATDLNYNLQPWEQTCLNNQSFSAGVFSASLVANCTSTYVDPIMYFGGMNPNPSSSGVQDPIIDTSKYRYFSTRFHHSGEQNVKEGWVARFGWWQTNATDNITTQEIVMGRDIIILEGWNTYNLDLWQADVVDEDHPIQRSWLDSAPNRLRFDPSELHSNLMPATVQVDWFKLTAMDEVQAGGTFNIEYEPVESGVDYAFYYDTDTNPDNGRSFIHSTALATTASVAAPFGGGTTFVYLPLLLNNYAPCTAEGCYAWNTTGVPAGTYHICIEADDGLNLIYRCSEAPMIIR